MHRAAAIALISLATFGGALAVAPLGAQASARLDTAEQAREALDSARRQQREARARVEQFEKQAQRSRETAGKAAAGVAALAARVQQSEAAVSAAEARQALAIAQRRALDLRLAQRREPLLRLTGALQSISRRPLTLSALQPGSLRDLVHTRAVLDTAVPLVRKRTAALRSELDRARALEKEAREALADRRESEAVLTRRRTDLAAAARRERRAAQRATGGAAREAQRALILSEQARDLDALVGQLEQAGSLREQLAALPGPIPRPENPAQARLAATPAPRASPTSPPARYILPVAGKVARGFGESGEGGPREAGIALLARAGAQLVAPGAGRVAFAGPYRGYGQIVIIEHDNGWTSLVTGLGQLDVAVGQSLTAGSPLGRAAGRARAVTLELRRDGTPVNPLDFLR